MLLLVEWPPLYAPPLSQFKGGRVEGETGKKGSKIKELELEPELQTQSREFPLPVCVCVF